MIQRQGQVLDEYGRPVLGASIYVFKDDGTSADLTVDGTTPLAQPVLTDEFGAYSYQADSSVYREDTYFGGKLRYREMVPIGEALDVLANAVAIVDAKAATQADASDASLSAASAAGFASQSSERADAASASANAAALSAQVALLNGKVWDTTAKALSNGVTGYTALVGGTGGTNGTFALAFTGGGGSGAQGTFTVAGGAVTAIDIDWPGDSYTSAPTISFAASAGLTGASATATIAQNNGDTQLFWVKGTGNSSADLYKNVGGTATLQTTLPSATATQHVLGLSSVIDSPFEYYPETTVVISDAGGEARLIEASGSNANADDPIVFNGTDTAVVSTTIASVLGYAQSITSPFEYYPDSLIVSVDTNGESRLVQAFSANPNDPTFYGGDGASSAIAPPDLPTEFLLIVIMGQSNGTTTGGNAAQALLPLAGVGYHYLPGTNALADLSDVASGAWVASFMPAMAKAIWEKTGRGVIFVNDCVGGTALIAPDDSGAGNWSATGTLRGATVSDVAAAKTYLDAHGYCYQHACDVLIQGERDAQQPVTQANYSAGLTDFRNWQTGTLSGSRCPLIISRTGSLLSGDTTGFQNVRAAQMAFARDNAGVFIGFTGALRFVADGLMYNGDGQGIHYLQAGKNRLGTHLGTVAAFVGAGVAGA